MARIRTIKPDFFTSADIVELSPLARLLYIAIWCEADRDGRLPWRPKTLKLRYLPADDCDIEQVADELVKAGLVAPYDVDGTTFAEVPSFTKHQIINNRETPSAIPPRVVDAKPTRARRVEHASTSRAARDDDALGTRGPRVTHATTTPLVGREGKEGKTRHDASRGTRLAPDWQPDESAVEYASKHGIVNGALTTEVERFRDYWTAKAGSDAVKADWMATWRNWCRKSVEFASAKQGPKSDSPDDLFRRGAA